MAVLLWLSVGLPALAALAARSAGSRARGVAVGGALLAALPPWALLVAAAAGERATSGVAWLPADGLDVGLRLDGLSAAMSATVGTVGAVVLAYSAGYFAREPRAPSAVAGLLTFLAAMQGLVLADGYLSLLVGWELVGVLSMRLIAFNRADTAAPAAAVRAFLTTRAADVGLYVALFALYAGAGSVAFGGARPDGALGALVGLGLVVAAMGKSAQAPLQTWLSGAMAGPTPVSALLHSATMVAAGVYLLVRSDGLLTGWPMEVAGWVGAVTAVLGAIIALGQDDLKRVLAGSTSSQLGLMFVGAAVGGPAVATFHLIAHAAGKATLFLAAGVFQHERGSTSLGALRGAGRADPTTMALWTVGALSIAAVPPLAAFWSKDAIVAASEGQAGWLVLVLLAGAGAAAYLLRPTLVLWRPGAQESQPAPGRRPMLLAAAALAGASLVLGLLAMPLADLLDAPTPKATPVSAGLSVAMVLLGAGSLLVAKRVPDRVAEVARRQLLVDEGLRAFVQAPFFLAARELARLDDRVLDDGAIDGTGRGTLRLARISRRAEESGVDAGVDGLAHLLGRGSDLNRRVQSGRLYEYLRDTVFGAVAVGLVIALAAVL